VITPQDVLEFWFAPTSRPQWFAANPEFDRLVGDVLGAAYDQAAAGALEEWRYNTSGCLALILLLDQVPRNLFRGTARAFATDAQALALAHDMIDQALDLTCRVDRRLFIYLPLEHSEDLTDQRLSVFMIRTRVGRSSYLDFAERHLRLIERFGRFPHRNAALGRASTPDEVAFLAESESGF
jgi:uncharacterized protein (DUF924 family)